MRNFARKLFNAVSGLTVATLITAPLFGTALAAPESPAIVMPGEVGMFLTHARTNQAGDGKIQCTAVNDADKAQTVNIEISIVDGAGVQHGDTLIAQNLTLNAGEEHEEEIRVDGLEKAGEQHAYKGVCQVFTHETQTLLTEGMKLWDRRNMSEEEKKLEPLTAQVKFDPKTCSTSIWFGNDPSGTHKAIYADREPKVMQTFKDEPMREWVLQNDLRPYLVRGQDFAGLLEAVWEGETQPLWLDYTIPAALLEGCFPPDQPQPESSCDAFEFEAVGPNNYSPVQYRGKVMATNAANSIAKVVFNNGQSDLEVVVGSEFTGVITTTGTTTATVWISDLHGNPMSDRACQKAITVIDKPAELQFDAQIAVSCIENSRVSGTLAWSADAPAKVLASATGLNNNFAQVWDVSAGQQPMTEIFSWPVTTQVTQTVQMTATVEFQGQQKVVKPISETIVCGTPTTIEQPEQKLFFWILVPEKTTVKQAQPSCMNSAELPGNGSYLPSGGATIMWSGVFTNVQEVQFNGQSAKPDANGFVSFTSQVSAANGMIYPKMQAMDGNWLEAQNCGVGYQELPPVTHYCDASSDPVVGCMSSNDVKTSWSTGHITVTHDKGHNGDWHYDLNLGFATGNIRRGYSAAVIWPDSEVVTSFDQVRKGAAWGPGSTNGRSETYHGQLAWGQTSVYGLGSVEFGKANTAPITATIGTQTVSWSPELLGRMFPTADGWVMPISISYPGSKDLPGFAIVGKNGLVIPARELTQSREAPSMGRILYGHFNSCTNGLAGYLGNTLCRNERPGNPNAVENIRTSLNGQTVAAAGYGSYDPNVYTTIGDQ